MLLQDILCSTALMYKFTSTLHARQTLISLSIDKHEASKTGRIKLIKQPFQEIGRVSVYIKERVYEAISTICAEIENNMTGRRTSIQHERLEHCIEEILKSTTTQVRGINIVEISVKRQESKHFAFGKSKRIF